MSTTSTSSFLFGSDSQVSVAVEHEDRIPTFIRSTHRFLPLMTGTVHFEAPAPASSITHNNGTFLTTLPVAGDCAMGGCADGTCTGSDMCGCIPGVDDACPSLPTPYAINSHRVSSNSNCVDANVPCNSWLDFKNCYPSSTTTVRNTLCPNLR